MRVGCIMSRYKFPFAHPVPGMCSSPPQDLTPTWCQSKIATIKATTGWNAKTNPNPNVAGNFCNANQDPLNLRYQKCCASCSSMSELFVEIVQRCAMWNAVGGAIQAQKDVSFMGTNSACADNTGTAAYCSVGLVRKRGRCIAVRRDQQSVHPERGGQQLPIVVRLLFNSDCQHNVDYGSRYEAMERNFTFVLKNAHNCAMCYSVHLLANMLQSVHVQCQLCHDHLPVHIGWPSGGITAAKDASANNGGKCQCDTCVKGRICTSDMDCGGYAGTCGYKSISTTTLGQWFYCISATGVGAGLGMV
ncbi:unnamed protein product [Sphagnum balticum]